MPKIRDLTDMLTVTLENQPRGEFQETLDRTNCALTKIVFRDSIKGKDGGFAMKDRLRVRNSTTAAFVNPYEASGAQQQNYMVSIVTDWVLFRDYMLFNEIEDDLNSGAEQQIVDLMKERESATFEGIYNLVEASLAREPNNSADTKALWGFPLWLRRISTSGTPDTDGGFNGVTARYLDGTTGTTIGAGSSAPDANDPANARLRNWNASYSGVFDVSCFRTIRKAINRTNFDSQGVPELRGTLDRGKRQVLLMAFDQWEQYQDLANAGPDDNNGDLTKFKSYKIHGLEPIAVDEFKNLTYNPIYGVKLGQVEGNVLRSRWMRRGKPIQDPNDSETYKVPITGSCNLRFRNIRHGGFVVSYVAGS